MSRPRPRRRPAIAASEGALRVIAGTLGGRRLDAPGGEGTRPTSDRVREATFNALESLGAVDGARVLDGFAGSGALGIEALSRGAAHVTFVEADAGARQVVERNLASLSLATRSSVVRGVLERSWSSLGRFDLVLLDPPYAFDGWEVLLGHVADHVTDAAIVVAESDRELAWPAGLEAVRSRTYGGTVVQFASPTGAPS